MAKFLLVAKEKSRNSDTTIIDLVGEFETVEAADTAIKAGVASEVFIPAGDGSGTYFHRIDDYVVVSGKFYAEVGSLGGSYPYPEGVRDQLEPY